MQDQLGISDTASTARHRVVAFGTVADTPIADAVRQALAGDGLDVIDVSTPCSDGYSWPDVGRDVGSAVAERKASTGIALCWTGSGVAISASTVSGVRAAFCSSPDEASSAREWHDANVIALSLHSTGVEAMAIVRAWLAAVPSTDVSHTAARQALAAFSSTTRSL